MRRTNKILAVILSVVMIIGILPVSAVVSFAAGSSDSGTCGENLTWMLNSDGLLRISGSGAMKDYDSETPPWKDSVYDIKSIVIGDSVTSIGTLAFSGLWFVEKLTIGSSVSSIGKSAFSGLGKLKKVALPGSLVRIESGAFSQCAALESIVIPDSVTYIGTSAFEFCTSLVSAVLGKGVRQLGRASSPLFGESFSGVFESCTALQSVVVGNSVEIIGDHTFANCLELRSVNIPNSVQTIGWYAISNCKKLTHVSIPAATTFIGYGCFHNSTALESIEVAANNPNYSSDERGVLFNKDKTVLIQYPLGNRAQEYKVPESVATINTYSFADCNHIKSVLLPASVTSIGRFAFGNDSNLYSLIISNNDCTIYDDEYTLYITATIYGNSGSTAEEYAEKYERHFRLIEDSAVYGEWVDNHDGTHSRTVTYIDETTETQTEQHHYSDWCYFDLYSDNAYKERSCFECGSIEKENTERKYFDANNTLSNPSDGVVIDYPDGALEDGTKLVTKHWSESDVESDSIFEAWYIALMKDGEEVQPTAPVVLKLKLPEGIHPYILPFLTLWHYVDGKWVQMETWIEDGYICCITDSFSPFSFQIGGDAPEDSGIVFDVDFSSFCKYCGQLHEGIIGKIVEFFHKIAYFFAHLFGTM